MENYNNELYHHGIKGMKWGVRRYQNADGTLTPAGKKRYDDDPVGRAKLNVKSANKEYKKAFHKANNKAYQAYSISKKKRQENDKRWKDAANKADALNKAKSDYKQVKKTHTIGKLSTKHGKSKEAAEAYYDKSQKNATTRKIGYGMTVAGNVLTHIGKQQYSQYKNNSTPGRTAVINGMGYAGKALQTIGPVMVYGGTVQQLIDYDRFTRR